MKKMSKTHDLQITVEGVEGTCPVYKVGDSFTILDGFKLKTSQSLCTHSLASLMPYYVPLSKGVKPEELGLGSGEEAYVQCLDPSEYTGGGTVVFEIRRKEDDE